MRLYKITIIFLFLFVLAEVCCWFFWTATGLGSAGSIDVPNILNDMRQHLDDFVVFMVHC